MTVFVPCTVRLAQNWRDEGIPPTVTGYAATVPMLEAHGLEPGEEEEGDFTALNYAATAALSLWAPGDRRLVLAIGREARPTVPRGMSQTTAVEVGAVQVADAEWRSVKAIFADEPAAADAVVAAHDALAGRSWPDAWEEPAIDDLVTGFDLLWYVPGELDALAEEGMN
ncbi:DUF6912 family protein [Enemella sp. A6]|uniref:DUF6912 family protein n=1 Tax=Enemella sp. A6 TaxID=3440152 RepID=UPI003EBEC6D3